MVRPVVENGVVTRLVVEDEGSGYDTPIVSFPGSTGTTAMARVRVANGVVQDAFILQAGSGYPATPSVIDVSLPGGTINAVIRGAVIGGSVVGAQVLNGGSGYPCPTIAISRPAGTSGTEASATAIIENGKLVSVDLVAGGSGYAALPRLESMTPIRHWKPWVVFGFRYLQRIIALCHREAMSTLASPWRPGSTPLLVICSVASIGSRSRMRH